MHCIIECCIVCPDCTASSEPVAAGSGIALRDAHFFHPFQHDNRETQVWLACGPNTVKHCYREWKTSKNKKVEWELLGCVVDADKPLECCVTGGCAHCKADCPRDFRFLSQVSGHRHLPRWLMLTNTAHVGSHDPSLQLFLLHCILVRYLQSTSYCLLSSTAYCLPFHCVMSTTLLLIAYCPPP